MAKLPSGIYHRGEKFRVKVEWQGVTKTATCSTLDEAIATRARLDADLKNPQATPELDEGGSSWTLKIAFDRTYAARWAGTKGEKTAVIFATAALEYFGYTRSLPSIDADAIDGYVDHLVKLGNSDATINRKLSMLSTMLTTAFDRKKLKVKPKMPHRKEYKGRIRFLSPEEETQILALAEQWDKLDEADAVAVFLDTGLRASELTYIEPRDINHSNKQNSVTVWENKGDEPRSIPLTTRAYSILRRRAITHKTKLFPYDKDWTRSFWDRAKAVMGLTEDKQFVIHALRHTFASRLVQRGVPLVAVQKLMGHKDIKTTMRYAHLAPNNFPDAIAVLEPQKVNA